MPAPEDLLSVEGVVGPAPDPEVGCAVATSERPRVNMIELAPKGTGKSFVFLNLSRYARLVSGGKVTAAALFYNNANRQPGLFSHYDLVIFDEAQS